MSATMDLSNVVLLLGNVQGTSDILELSENRRFKFEPIEEDDAANWRGGEKGALTGPFLCLTFGQHMYSPLGWVGGSSPDSDDCDIQLATNNKSGVSRRHFLIDVDPQGQCPRLTNLSRNDLRIEDDRVIVLRQGDYVDIVSPVTINLGQVLLRAWRPILSDEEKRLYKKNVENFHREYMKALPKPANSNLSVAPTPDLRFGLRNAVYKREEATYAGVGSFASVMKVKELNTNKMFAAKVPHYKLTDASWQIRKRWESLSDEFQKLVKLKHARIVEAVEILMGRNETEPPWLIMEWIPHDLDSVSLNPYETPILLRQVGSGLAFMHDNGFAHRDLKPENILIDRSPEGVSAKIADFGISKYNVHGKMQTYAGSIAYMAPELLGSVRAYTNAVDMWSFGIIAVKLLTDWVSISQDVDEGMHSGTGWWQDWARNTVMPRLDLAPETFRPLLRGLLSERPEGRLTASACEAWLLTNGGSASASQAGGGASMMSLLEESRRHVRSPHPTLSTAPTDHSSPCSTVPDTEAWCSQSNIADVKDSDNVEL